MNLNTFSNYFFFTVLRYAARTFTKYIPFKAFFCRGQQRGGEDPEVGIPHPVPQQVPQFLPEDQDGGDHGGVQQYSPPPPPQLFRGDEIFLSDQEDEEEQQQEENNNEFLRSWRHVEVQTDPQMESSGAGHFHYLEDEFCNIFPHADVATTSSSTQPSSSNSSNSSSSNSTSGYFGGGGGDDYTEDEYDNDDDEEDEDYEPSDLYYLQEPVTHTSRVGRTVQVPPGMASRPQQEYQWSHGPCGQKFK